jgi:hypothetical protein
MSPVREAAVAVLSGRQDGGLVWVGAADPVEPTTKTWRRESGMNPSDSGVIAAPEWAIHDWREPKRRCRFSSA